MLSWLRKFHMRYMQTNFEFLGLTPACFPRPSHVGALKMLFREETQ